MSKSPIPIKLGDQFAYPCPDDAYDEYLGLTKRELFAAMAMQSILSNSYSSGVSQQLSEASPSQIATWPVFQADALIEALG